MNENRYIVPIFSIILLFGFLFVFHYFYSNFNELDSYSITASSDFWRNNRLKLNANESFGLQHTIFPKEVHQMWKAKSLPPQQTLRWRAGCQALNPYHDFNMMDDDDLKAFVHREYPQYVDLFDALKGVCKPFLPHLPMLQPTDRCSLDMADMARFIIAYHHGGVYLDLDFYCHRPLFCLEQHALEQIGQLSNHNTVHGDILIVSREPVLHAKFIHNADRIVIQDFIMVTARHPFLKWLLDSRAEAFAKDAAFAKTGPFSYHIDKALDEYYALTNSKLVQGHESSLAVHRSNGTVAYVLELQAEVLHPLLDATNSRLVAGCSKAEGGPYGAQCKQFSKGEYLFPVEDTVLVHMWTHTFLGTQPLFCLVLPLLYTGWNMLRGWYNSKSYGSVEKRLPPLARCHFHDQPASRR